MRLPEMPYTPSLKKSVQTKFGGYNHNIGAGDGEIFDMLNLTSDYNPVLSTRGKRYDAGAVNADNGIIYVDDEQYRVHGTNLYHNNILIGTVADSEKTFAVLPYYLVMYPDKKVIRLRVKGYYADLTALAAAVTTPETNDIYGVGSAGSYASYYWSGTEWTQSGQVVENIEASWTGGVTFIADGEYAGVPADNNTIYNAAVDWSDYFRVGDAVEISGSDHVKNNRSVIIREIAGTLLRFYENSFTLDHQWKHEVVADGDFVIADYQSTTPYYTNLKSFYFKTDDELVIFQPNPASETVPKDTDHEVVYIRGGYGFLYKDGKLYYTYPTSLHELASYSTYQKVTLIGADQYKAANVQVSRKTFYYTLDGQTVMISLTNEQYAVVGGETCDFILYKSNNDSGGQLFIQNDSVAINFAVTVTELGEKVSFYIESLDYYESDVTIRRTAPALDFVFGHNNRIWGCKADKIYASKLGDPFNFNALDGLTTDSYEVETGTPGDFTGVFSYLGYPLFFKEDAIFKIYGSYPSEYQVVPSAKSGVKAGSDRSLAVAGEVLYYHNKAGIMAYTGGTPSLVSDALGDELFHDAIAGSDGKKYYVDMKDAANVHHLFVYDGLWMKEETEGMQSFVNYSGELWAYNGHLVAISAKSAPAGTTAETAVDWMMETADITADSPNKKGVSGFQIRCEIAGSMTIKLQCDGGAWELKGSYSATQKRTLLIPILPQRADRYRLKMEGTGTFQLYGIAIQTYDGSEI